jgi:hypothetical protein
MKEYESIKDVIKELPPARFFKIVKISKVYVVTQQVRSPKRFKRRAYD